MRKDIGRVIVDRPRDNPSRLAKSAKTALRVRLSSADWDDVDAGPVWQSSAPSRLYHQNAKSLTDVLGPLKRFLRARIGRPWASIDKEVRAAVDARSMRGRHVLAHLEQMVEIRTAFYEGRICKASAPSGQGYWREVWGFYVHPRTGLLAYNDPRRAR